MTEGCLNILKIREKHGYKTCRKTAYWERNPGFQKGRAERLLWKDFITCLSRKAFISRNPFVYLFGETGLKENPWPAYIRLHKPVKVCDWRGEAFEKNEKMRREGIW